MPCVACPLTICSAKKHLNIARPDITRLSRGPKISLPGGRIQAFFYEIYPRKVEFVTSQRSTKMGQIEKNGTKAITMEGCSYDPKGSFGSEKVWG